MTKSTFEHPYQVLREALDAAFEQSAHGKGARRHANGRSFDRQPIHEVGRIVGIGFTAGQAMKKAGEAAQMAQRGEHEAAMAEFLGVIVYAAVSWNLIREQLEPAPVTKSATSRETEEPKVDMERLAAMII